jgi:hypothetical protein
LRRIKFRISVKDYKNKKPPAGVDQPEGGYNLLSNNALLPLILIACSVLVYVMSWF